MKTKRPADTATPNASPADAARGKAAYDKLLPRLRALHANDLTHINVDVGSAALVALGVAGRVTQPVLHARFEHLAGPESIGKTTCLVCAMLDHRRGPGALRWGLGKVNGASQNGDAAHIQTGGARNCASRGRGHAAGVGLFEGGRGVGALVGGDQT